ncbi:type II secretion system protein [Verrucomicrobium spinosum]|uniref:type II secretion system protein n=1 Tax=Verrucomicrobium spinosum TaxID=2736 RepID=UPI0001744D74|nr:type II secretion system protein [Verrucomicrobium spinosum]
MKIHHLHKTRRFNRAAGFTLIEVSLVIALLLGLIAVVFLGLGAYRKGADQAKCRMQLATIQKAVRSYANYNNLAVGDAVPAAAPGSYMDALPPCPSDGSTPAVTGLVPAIGSAFATCAVTGPPSHALVASTIADW